VAGVGGKNEFVPRLSRRSNAKAEGTIESSGGFPASFQDAQFCGRGFQPECGWLISDAPSEQSAQLTNLETTRLKTGQVLKLFLVDDRLLCQR